MNNLMPKMVPTFLPMAKITTVFEDQYQHIIQKTMRHAETCLSNPDSRQAVMFCPPGSGKTTAWIVDLIWRIADLAKKSKKKNQLFVFTSPDDSINQDVYNQLLALYKLDGKYEMLEEIGLNWYGLYQDPKEITGRGLEIVACSIQKATGDEGKGQYKELKKHKITALISDEAHRGLGCTDKENYERDIGYTGSDFEAIWYWKCRGLNYDMWFGLTGTPTESQKWDTDDYVVISKDMEKSDWRLPFFEKMLTVFDPQAYDYQIKCFFLEISKRNAIGKYYKSKFDYVPEPISELSETKVTGMIRCGIEGSKYPKPSYVLSKWNELCKEYQEKTFEYDGVELPYHIGKCAIMTHELKTGGDNNGTINLLNDENSDYVAAAVMYIGSVGINITNLGVVSILPVVKNKGDVDNNLRQFISRMDRCKYVWRGSFANEVAQINDPKIVDNMVKLAVNTSSKKLFCSEGGLATGAYFNVRDNHVLVEDAVGFLKGLISIFRESCGYSSVSGKERDLAYKNARKDKCEFSGCNCYKTLVLESKEKSKSIRELAYQKILQVDHIDGDRENMAPENLITLCPNRHSIKTMNNKDYLKEYE